MFNFRDLEETLPRDRERDDFNFVFTRPEQFDHRHIPSSCSPDRYLQVVSQNVKAEYWSMFQQLVKPSFPGWRAKRLTTYHLERYEVQTDALGRRVMKYVRSLRLEGALTGTDIQELIKHLVAWRGRLFLTTTSPPDNDKLLLVSAGVSLDADYPDDLAEATEDVLYSFGYVGSFLVQLRACESLRERTHEPIIQAVANPSLRQPIATTLRPLDLRVPCNAGQHAALEGFHHNVEGLQGDAARPARVCGRCQPDPHAWRGTRSVLLHPVRALLRIDPTRAFPLLSHPPLKARLGLASQQRSSTSSRRCSLRARLRW